MNSHCRLDKAGVVGGRVLPLWVEQRPKSLGNKPYQYLSVIDWVAKLRESDKDNWLVGCNIAYNREALLRIGGFSRALVEMETECCFPMKRSKFPTK